MGFLAKVFVSVGFIIPCLHQEKFCQVSVSVEPIIPCCKTYSHICAITNGFPIVKGTYIDRV